MAFHLSGFADEIGPDPAEQIEGLRANGVRFIEIRKVGASNVLDLAETGAGAFRDALRAAGIGVSAIGSPIGKVPADGDPEAEFQRFQTAVERAHFFGTPNIRVFSFYPGALAGGDYRDAVLRQLERMIAFGAAAGVRLLHENEKNIYGESPEGCLDLMRSLGGPAFKAVWDPANFIQADVADIEAAWRDLSPYVVYFHIKDAQRETRGVVPAGQGDGCIAQVLSSAAEAGFDGFLSLEPHLRADPYGATGAERFRVAVTALRSVLSGFGAKAD